jgi:glutaredoxin
MRAPLAATLLALGLAIAFMAQAQQLYRWVDKDGHVHYTQQPPPREAAKSVESRRLSGSVVEAPKPYALEQATKNYPVTLYTSDSCKEGCVEARELLKTRGIPFKEVAVGDVSTFEQLKKVTGDNKVPALTVGTDVRHGFDESAYHAALDAAGYPRSGTAPSASRPR